MDTVGRQAQIDCEAIEASSCETSDRAAIAGPMGAPVGAGAPLHETVLY
jgi:hypothetical protein